MFVQPQSLATLNWRAVLAIALVETFVLGVLWGGTLGGSYARMGSIVSLIYVLGMGLIWLAPETKGRVMPE